MFAPILRVTQASQPFFQHFRSSGLIHLVSTLRKWIFGGTGLTTRGLHVDGVDNDGVNVHHYPGSQSVEDEPLIALVGVGASTINEININIMGDFRERLHWSRAPLTGYGGSNSTAVTTLPDGSPTFSVDDDVFPLSFFNPKTGDFIDNAQNRERARLCK
jgi:integrator complex subunit 6